MKIKRMRIELWDALRGILAVLIMVYHYLMWLNVEKIYPFNQFIDRIGIYAVSMFFIISGAVLSMSYLGKEVNKEFLINFFNKRIMRIVPLFYLATTITILLGLVNSTFPKFTEILSNYSLIFGFLSPQNYIVTGGWFIGNQVVFYVLFPLMLLLLNKSFKSYLFFFILSMLSTLYYSFVLLDSTVSLSEQWSIYINPMNQLFFFTGGIMLGYLYTKGFIKLKKEYSVVLMVISMLMFIFYSSSSNTQIDIITGVEKVVFSAIVFCLCISLMFLNTKSSYLIIKISKKLGDISYPLYLLHPIIYTLTSGLFTVLRLENNMLKFVLSIILSIITSAIAQYIDNLLATRISQKSVVVV